MRSSADLFPQLQPLTPDQRKSVLEKCLRSEEYQKGFRESERLGWAYMAPTLGVVIGLLAHRYWVALCCFPLAALFGVLRIVKKKKQFEILRQLVIRQVGEHPAKTAGSDC